MRNSWNNQSMRLVWVVIPLILIGIVGIQESFADENKIYHLSLDYGIIKIPYDIPNGSIDKITLDADAGTMLIMIESVDEGIFSIDLIKFSRFIDLGFGDMDNIFVLVDGRETKFEHNKTFDSFIFNFHINSNSKNIEIVASSMEKNMPGPPQSWVDHKLLKFDKIYSPYQQVKNNIDSKDIVCKEGLELIFKSSNNFPACVKPETAEKLIQRGGWKTYFGYYPSTITKISSMSINPKSVN